MKTINTLQNGSFEITPEVFLILSWIATIDKQTKPGTYPTDKDRWLDWGLNTALTCLNVPFQLGYDIRINKHYTGYQNMNRLSEKVYFE